VLLCTNGEARTGFTAATVLTPPGVPKETVTANCLRVNLRTVPQLQQAIIASFAGGGERSVALALFGGKPEYLQAPFDEMQKPHGTRPALRAGFLGK
jgi:protein-tyrosine phosphatase